MVVVLPASPHSSVPAAPARRGRLPTAGLRVVAIVAVLGMAGCGGRDDPPSATGSDAAPAPASAASPPAPAAAYRAEIRRTTMGVAHVKAADWKGLGYGAGYAQATDALCTIADAMLTYRGERSRFFGPTAKVTNDSTIGQPPNLESDFFHLHLLDDARITALKAAQPDPLRQMVAGYAAGYSRYVREIRSSTSAAHAACRAEPWVRALSEDDVWRRMHAATLAGGHANFLALISSAQPPTAPSPTAPSPTAPSPTAPSAAAPSAAQLPAQPWVAPSAQADADVPDPPRLAIEPGSPPSRVTPLPRFALRLGNDSGIGSNMIGFGTAATGSDSPLLFGNPHWYWKGPDRFYQMQLTIDGQLDVSGASFLGMPVVLIGFNNDVAWSHTVSTARRFGLYQYTPDPTSPTRIVLDGKPVPLEARELVVAVRDAAGAIGEAKRTLYRSPHGPMIQLGALDPGLAWSAGLAFAIRDVNESNYRTYRSWTGWAQSKSLDEFVAVQKREAAVPWVNTVAVGRGSARAWYADIGAIPNVPDTVLAGCTTPIAAALAAALPAVPVLDGSKAACDWQSDADSVQPGALGVARMPSLQREDFVQNNNDSYWLTNASAPLTGFPAIVGPVGTPQSLRTRLGQIMVRERLAGTDGYAGRFATPEIVREMVLDSRVYSAELLRQPVLRFVCDGASDLAAPCAVLAAWDGKGNADSRGAILWDAFWQRAVVAGDASRLFAQPFDPARPIDTPRDLSPDAIPVLRGALGAAAATLTEAGLPLDVAKGSLLFAARGGTRLPLFGGCHDQGYFTILCPANTIETDRDLSVDKDAHGNSYLQVVSFPATGVEAWTFLTFSLSDDPASPHFSDYTAAYSNKAWLRVPFTDGQIKADPAYATTTVDE